MGRYRSRSRSRSHSPVRRSKHYDDPRERRRDRRSPGPSGLLVRNLPLDARQEDLRIPFEKYGPLKDVYLPKNYYTGEPRGFGFVKYRHPEDAAEAKEHLNHTVIGGREIRIVYAEENRKTPQDMRRRTGSSGRGSYRRRSPPRSPRRRGRSLSRSPSPPRYGSRDRGGRRGHRSPRRSRSITRSPSPRDERSYKVAKRSPRRSRSISRSPPRDKRGEGTSRHHLSPAENGHSAHDADFIPDRSPSPIRNSRSPSRSRSRSYSPR